MRQNPERITPSVIRLSESLLTSRIIIDGVYALTRASGSERDF